MAWNAGQTTKIVKMGQQMAKLLKSQRFEVESKGHPYVFRGQKKIAKSPYVYGHVPMVGITAVGRSSFVSFWTDAKAIPHADYSTD